MTKYKYYIGIDCGVRTGLCVWDNSGKKIITIDTYMIHEAMKYVEKVCITFPGDEIMIRVEDARLRKWIPRQENEKSERGRREGAGSVKRDAKIWEDFLTDLKKVYGINFEMVAPKNNKTKITPTYLTIVCGYKGITSVHARDAAMLVIGF